MGCSALVRPTVLSLKGLLSALGAYLMDICKAIPQNILGAQNGPVESTENQRGSVRAEACKPFITQRLIKRRKFRELIEAERKISRKAEFSIKIVSFQNKGESSLGMFASSCKHRFKSLQELRGASVELLPSFSIPQSYTQSSSVHKKFHKARRPQTLLLIFLKM